MYICVINVMYGLGFEASFSQVVIIVVHSRSNLASGNDAVKSS